MMTRNDFLPRGLMSGFEQYSKQNQGHKIILEQS